MSKKKTPVAGAAPNDGVPAQQDEADITDEVGAAVDDETGAMTAPEDKVLSAGALDAESVRENRRLQDIVSQKRANKKGVPFNAGDVVTKYDWIIQYWPANTLYINVKRLTGTPVQRMILSHPRSGAELWTELMALHGSSEEAKYEVSIIDSNDKSYRGKSQIVLEDTRPLQQRTQQQGPYMQAPPPGYPPGYPPPYGTPGYGYPPPQGYPQQYPPQAAPQAQAQPAQAAAPQPQQPPQPIYVQPSPGPDPMAMFRQMFEMVQSVTPQQQPPQPAPAQAPQWPTPPTSADPAVMMQWMREMFELVRQAQPRGGAAQAHVQPPQQAPMQMGPTRPPPPGMVWVWEPSFQSFVLMPAPSAAPGPSPFARGPRPTGYFPHGEPGVGAPPPQHQPPPRPQTFSEQFRETMSAVRSVRGMQEEIQSIFGGEEPTHMPQDDDDGSPVKIVDTGSGKIAFGKEDGNFRLLETGFANLTEMLKWGGEQVNKINKANAERAQRQEQQLQQPRVLADGTVEVPMGWRPPPGVRMEVVEQPQAQHAQPQPQQDPLPQPPANVPPPLEQGPTPRQAWGEG